MNYSTSIMIMLLLSLGALPAIADPCEAPLPASGEKFSGEVTYVVDGDGFCVGKDRGGIEVRVADFNACELNEPGGEAAKQNLRKIVFGKMVECVADKRSYDRTIAVCTVEGQKVGDVLRRAGTCEGGRGR
jgi:micrococcal nuclease